MIGVSRRNFVSYCVSAQEVAAILREIDHRAEITALAIGRRRRHAGQNCAIETRRADVGRLIIEHRVAARDMEDRALGVGRGLVGVAIEASGRLPLARDAFLREHAWIVGGETLSDAVLEDDVVAAVAKRRDEALVPPVVLHREHHGVADLDRVVVRGRARRGRGVMRVFDRGDVAVVTATC